MQKFFPAAHDYEVIHRNLYVTHQRVAATFRKGRVVLAGDSAHVNNPIGGMGLNGGLQDGANLSDKLARILLDGAPDRLLDIYDRQRRTVAVEFVQEQSIANKKRLGGERSGGPQAELRRPARDGRRSGAGAAIPAAYVDDLEPAPRRLPRTGRRMTMLAPEQTSRPRPRPFLDRRQAIRRRHQHAAGFPRSLPCRIRQPREGSRRVRALRHRRRPRRGRRVDRALERRQAGFRDRRHADGHQGHHRDRRHADRDGLAAVRRLALGEGRGLRLGAAAGRRGHPRQDRDHRIRRHRAARHPQPLQSRAHAGRIVERLGRRGRLRHAERRRSARR